MKSKIENPPSAQSAKGPLAPTIRGDAAKSKIVFIGAGNMTEALARGILKAGIYRARDMLVTDIDKRRLVFFQRKLGVSGSSDNKKAALSTGLIIVAVKPQQAPQVFAELRGNLPDNPLLISIVTGFSIRKIMAAIGQPARIIRVVPNTPALVGLGTSAYCCNKRTTVKDECLAKKILEAIGVAIRLEEPLMNAVTALSGSGPAYVFYLIEALLKAGREMRLPAEAARLLTVSTVAGAAGLQAKTGLPPEELRRRVTSHGGTTEAAIKILEKGKIQQTVIAAIKAAHKRARELSA